MKSFGANVGLLIGSLLTMVMLRYAWEFGWGDAVSLPLMFALGTVCGNRMG